MDRYQKAQLNVLVVEQDKFHLMAISDLLSLSGVIVVQCENVVLAKKELLNGEHKFDFIMISLQMPQMDELELLKYIKNDKQLQSTPVFMISNDEDAQARATCLQAGAFDYIIKPIRIQKLQQCIEQVRKHKQD